MASQSSTTSMFQAASDIVIRSGLFALGVVSGEIVLCGHGHIHELHLCSDDVILPREKGIHYLRLEMVAATFLNDFQAFL